MVQAPAQYCERAIDGTCNHLHLHLTAARCYVNVRLPCTGVINSISVQLPGAPRCSADAVQTQPAHVGARLTSVLVP
jgi:hypothetical protein